MRRSRVHATAEEWNKIVAEGFKRGMFAYVPEDQVFVNEKGEKVVNGAMGVDKVKVIDGVEKDCLRFISVFCPINDYMADIPGDDDKLPYVGQVCDVMAMILTTNIQAAQGGRSGVYRDIGIYSPPPLPPSPKSINPIKQNWIFGF